MRGGHLLGLIVLAVLLPGCNSQLTWLCTAFDSAGKCSSCADYSFLF
jgi:hypothetical protein